MDEFSAQETALEQGVVGRGAEYAQHLKKVVTQQQTVVRSQQDVAFNQVQSSGTSVAQPVRFCDMLARVKEFDGDGEDGKMKTMIGKGRKKMENKFAMTIAAAPDTGQQRRRKTVDSVRHVPRIRLCRD